MGATMLNSGMFTEKVVPSTIRSIRYVPTILPMPDFKLQPDTY